MAHKLKEVRESKGISQTFIAGKIGYTPTHYGRIENTPDYVPKITTAYQLSKLLDTPIDELFPAVKINN